MKPAWMYFTTKEQWKRYIHDLLDNSCEAVTKAIICIDNRQTEIERLNGESIDDNNVGWTKYDAHEMGEIANKVRSGQQLTSGEFAKSKNKMKKYWKQLMVVSINKQQQEEQKQQQEEQQRSEIEAQQFRVALEVLKQCEQGHPCDYGICDECPICTGYHQMSLPINIKRGVKK